MFPYVDVEARIPAQPPLRAMRRLAGLAQVKVRGLAKVRAVFVFATAAYNIARPAA